jgi:hypothetical protein
LQTTTGSCLKLADQQAKIHRLHCNQPWQIFGFVTATKKHRMAVFIKAFMWFTEQTVARFTGTLMDQVF